MAINTGDTKNSLFGALKKSAKQASQTGDSLHQKEGRQEIAIEPKENTGREHLIPPSESTPESIQPKWQTFDKVTVLLNTEQKNGLDRVAKKLMKFRAKDLKGRNDKERITTNTLIRALIDNFLQLEEAMQMEVLTSENDVSRWLKRMFKH